MAFMDDFRNSIPTIVARLKAKGISEELLRFGGEGEARKGRIVVPTDARSEFLANRAMGDWAEQLLIRSFNAQVPTHSVVQYGNTNETAAGDPKFKEMFLNGIEEVRRFGKRPDLLVFPRGKEPAAPLSSMVF